MRHLDLFSGIGGFALAARWMNWETVQFVELDKFCQRVLEKNFPGVPIHGDIKTFDGTRFRGAVDIVTGGFPCQTFSTAGKGQADLSLWKEMFRVIGEVRPRLVVAENVYGLLTTKKGVAFECVCADLESEGYQVQAFVIPACAVNAPHRRDRVWIVAHANEFISGTRRPEPKGQFGEAGATNGGYGITSNTYSNDAVRYGHGETGQTQGEGQEVEEERKRVRAVTERTGAEGTITDSNQFGLEGRNTQAEGECTTIRNDWSQFPIESPLRPGNDGLSPGLVRSSIQAGGNAVVPALVFEIFRAIQYIDYELQSSKRI